MRSYFKPIFISLLFVLMAHGISHADSVLDALTEAAGNEDGEAQVILGQIYSRGDGVDQDDLIAAHWFERAAENGEALGQYFYAWSLQEGYGVSQDMERALSWYRAAAEQGNGDASEMVQYLERQIVDQVAATQEDAPKEAKQTADVVQSQKDATAVSKVTSSIEFLIIRANFNASSGNPEQFVNLLIEKGLTNRAEEKKLYRILADKNGKR